MTGMSSNGNGPVSFRLTPVARRPCRVWSQGFFTFDMSLRFRTRRSWGDGPRTRIDSTSMGRRYFNTVCRLVLRPRLLGASGSVKKGLNGCGPRQSRLGSAPGGEGHDFKRGTIDTTVQEKNITTRRMPVCRRRHDASWSGWLARSGSACARITTASHLFWLVRSDVTPMPAISGGCARRFQNSTSTNRRR